MLKRFQSYAALLFFVVASATSGRAQNENTPPPTAPCVGALSGDFTFVKKFTYPSQPSDPNLTNGQQPAPAAPANPATQMKEFAAVQTGGVRRDTETYVDGTSREMWRQQNYRFVFDAARPNSILVTFVATPGGGFSLSQYHDPSDFAELDWIKINLFKGIQLKQGKTCYTYKLDDQTAWIDVSTKLPVTFESKAMQVTYVYPPPPDAPLRLPAKLDQKLQQFKRAWSGQD